MSFILSIDKAAKSAGYSLRQFRRLYNERDGGKVTVIGGKAFVLTKDLEKWKEKRNGFWSDWDIAWDGDYDL